MAIEWTTGRSHISQITIPNAAHKTDASAPANLTYYVKDAEARDMIANLAAAGIKFTKSTTAGTTPEGVTWGDEPNTVTGTLKPTFQAAEAPLPSGFSVGDPRPNIYLVPDKNGKGQDVYVEFVVVQVSDSPVTYAWETLGNTEIDFEALGELAYADTATGSTTISTADSASFSNGEVTASATYTPAGTVGTPTITVTPSTGTVNSKATDGSVSAGTAASFTRGTFNGGSFTQGTDSFTAPTLTTSVSGETLTISFDEGSFTQGSDSFTAATHGEDTFSPNTPTSVTLPTFTPVTVATGIESATSTQPSFTGTAATISSTGTATGDVTLTKSNKTVTITVSPD